MAAAAAATSSLRPPPPTISASRRSRSNESREGRWAEPREVLRRDTEFIGKRLRWTEPLRERVSTALADLFWLRNLEDDSASANTTHDHHHSSSPWPNIRHPPGLSGKDLLMADLDALNVYASYFYQKTKIWSMPLPNHYDPQKISHYFSCRPHVVAFRMLEVLFSFGNAALRVRFSESLQNLRKSTDTEDSYDSSKYYVGQILKESMLNLGPAFIKVGQSLSTRPDIIGAEISKALSDLHENVPPFARVAAVKIIEEELGSAVENNFRYISEEPAAAASFGQVYQACTLDGCIVAVKVQRPNLLHAVVRDVYILRLGLGLLRKIAKRRSDLCLYADEVGKGLVGELDYMLEAANASEFREAHSHFSFISIPKVYKHLTRRRVLTMEWVSGESPSDLLSLSGLTDHEIPKRIRLEAKRRLLDLVNKGVEASLVQLLETGLLHADPHPGNLRYTPEGRIGFLDFGLVCRMEKRHQLAMLASIIHIVNGDWGALVYDLTEMEVVRRGTNLRRVTMDLEDALGEVAFEDGIPDIKFSKILGKILSVALRYQFRMPPYYTLLLRSLASLEGLALAADPDFKTFQAACPYVVTKLLYDNSAATRRILFSVVFNRKREFQWQKIMLFLRIGSVRKNTNDKIVGARNVMASSSKGGVYEIANLLLQLLPSKKGVVLRRLLMEADPVHLSQAIVSKDAHFYRWYASRAIADLIFQWMVRIPGAIIPYKGEHSSIALGSQQGEERVLKVRSLSTVQPVLKDRRLKVIFFKMLNGIRSHPILLLRLCWCSIAMSVTAVALAMSRFAVYCSETLLASMSPTMPKRLAVGGT